MSIFYGLVQIVRVFFSLQSFKGCNRFIAKHHIVQIGTMRLSLSKSERRSFIQNTENVPSTKGDLPITLYLKLQIFIAPISVKKHNIVDWYISYFAVLCDISLDTTNAFLI